MRQTLSIVCLVVVVGVTAGTGLVRGRLTHRWGAPADLVAGAKRVKSLPTEFGEWRLQAEHELNAIVTRTLRCEGYVNRTYANQETGESVNVAVLVGPAGPTSVHTPEICYSSREYDMVESPHRVSVRGAAKPEEQLWAITFRSHNVAGDELRVYYGWATEGPWLAPDQPRMAFGGERMLYKMQLAGYVVPGPAARKSDPCLNFLRDFLPVADRELFAAAP